VARVPARHADRRLHVSLQPLLAARPRYRPRVAAAISATRPSSPAANHPTALPRVSWRRDCSTWSCSAKARRRFSNWSSASTPGASGATSPASCTRRPTAASVATPARPRMTAIDDLPYPDWDAWSIEAYIAAHQVDRRQSRPLHALLGSRGAVRVHVFVRTGDVDPALSHAQSSDLADEMRHMKARYRVTGFTFMDSTFVVNRKKTLDFANELIRRGLGVSYQLPAGTRCEAFDQELATALDRSGLGLCVRARVGDEQTLKAIKKQVSLPRPPGRRPCRPPDEDDRRLLHRHRLSRGHARGHAAHVGLVRKLAVMGVTRRHDLEVHALSWDRLFHAALSRQGVRPVRRRTPQRDQLLFEHGQIVHAGCLVARAVRPDALMYLNFLLLSFGIRPWRVVKNFWQYFRTGVENARYMRFFAEMSSCGESGLIGAARAASISIQRVEPFGGADLQVGARRPEVPAAPSARRGLHVPVSVTRVKIDASLGG